MCGAKVELKIKGGFLLVCLKWKKNKKNPNEENENSKIRVFSFFFVKKNLKVFAGVLILYEEEKNESKLRV